VRGDRTAGQVSGTGRAEQVTAASQQLQHVVEQVAGARTPFAQVLFGQQAQRLAVHLEQLGVEPRQVEFDLGPLYERVHVFFGPNSRVGNCEHGQKPPHYVHRFFVLQSRISAGKMFALIIR